MKPPIFIDTGYILALINTADEHHGRAAAAARQIKPPFLTTEAVLTEIGNPLSRARWRALGYATIQDLRADPHIRSRACGCRPIRTCPYVVRRSHGQGMGFDRLPILRRDAGAKHDASVDDRPALRSGRVREPVVGSPGLLLMVLR